MARNLHELGLQQLFVFNRNIRGAEEIARKFAGQAASLDSLPNFLPALDLLVLATSSPKPILHVDVVRVASAERTNSPLLVIDLGVPQNVETAVSELPHVRLLEMSEVIELAAAKSGQRDDWRQQVRELLTDATEKFLAWQREHAIASMLDELRSNFEEVIFSETVRTWFRQTADVESGEKAQCFAQQLSNRLLHSPIMGLKEIAVRESPDRATQLGRVLFLRDKAREGV